MRDPLVIGKHLIIDEWGNVPLEIAVPFLSISLICIVLFAALMVSHLDKPVVQNIGIIFAGAVIIVIGVFLIFRGLTGSA